MTDGHEEPLLVGSRGWSRILIPATFFSLGAESSVTLSTVTLAAAYYKDTLGDSIVAALITSHVSVQLVVMLAILVGIRDVLRNMATAYQDIIYHIAMLVFANLVACSSI